LAVGEMDLLGPAVEEEGVPRMGAGLAGPRAKDFDQARIVDRRPEGSGCHSIARFNIRVIPKITTQVSSATHSETNSFLDFTLYPSSTKGCSLSEACAELYSESASTFRELSGSRRR